MSNTERYLCEAIELAHANLKAVAGPLGQSSSRMARSSQPA
jgi:hypothetical protein